MVTPLANGSISCKRRLRNHQGIRVDIQKAPILLSRQAAFPDGLFNGSRFSCTLPIETAVMAAGNILFLGICIQNIRLLLQLIRIGIKIVAVQIADICSLGLTEKAAADRIESFNTDIRWSLFSGYKIHHKYTHSFWIPFLPLAQLFDRIICRAIISAQNLNGKVCLLVQYTLQRFIHIGGQVIKRDQDADLGCAMRFPPV